MKVKVYVYMYVVCMYVCIYVCMYLCMYVMYVCKYVGISIKYQAGMFEDRETHGQNNEQMNSDSDKWH